jgi:hypothetical protein
METIASLSPANAKTTRGNRRAHNSNLVLIHWLSGRAADARAQRIEAFFVCPSVKALCECVRVDEALLNLRFQIKSLLPLRCETQPESTLCV